MAEKETTSELVEEAEKETTEGEPTGEPTGEEAPKKEFLWICKEHGVIEEPVVEQGRKFCSICHKLLSKKTPEEAQKVREEAEKIEEEVGPIKPPEVEAQERAIQLLWDRLPSIYGLTPERAHAIVETLKQNPSILSSPQALYYHIVQMAGKQLNQYQLNLVLSGVIQESGLYQPQPMVPPPMLGQPQPQAPFWGGQAQYPQFGAPQYGPYQWQGWPQQPTAPTKLPKTFKIVVDGQEIETDEKGFLAWKQYLDDRSERELRRDEVKRPEEKVKIPNPSKPDELIEVPVSQAALYVSLQHARAESERLQSEIARPEPTVKIPVGEKEVTEVPQSQAPYFMQTQWAQSERERIRHEAERTQAAYDKLKEEITPEAIAKKAEAMGFARTGSPAFSLISTAKEDFETKSNRLFGLLERQAPAMARGPIYGPSEREKKAEEVGKKIEGAERLLGSEEELIRAAHELSTRDREKK